MDAWRMDENEENNKEWVSDISHHGDHTKL